MLDGRMRHKDKHANEGLLAAGARFEHAIDAGHDAFAYVHEGAVDA